MKQTLISFPANRAQLSFLVFLGQGERHFCFLSRICVQHVVWLLSDPNFERQKQTADTLNNASIQNHRR